MATLQYFIFSSLKFLFYHSFVLLMLFLTCSNESEALKTQFHTLDLDVASQELDTSICNSNIPPSGLEKKQSVVLEVIHNQGPCVEQQNPRKHQLNLTQILHNDQLRVASIQNGDVRFRITSGDFLYTYTYIVAMSLGTPSIKLFLVFDTQNDLIWTQCLPCALGCYNQIGKMFNPNKSSSYSPIPCNSNECHALNHSTTYGPTCSSKRICSYNKLYADGSMSLGYLSKDKLKIAPNMPSLDVVFGCSQFAQGYFGMTSGLVGLGTGSLSLVKQTAKVYLQRFSYCFPSIFGKGFLTLGKDGDDSRTEFTPIIDGPGLSSTVYNIEIISMAMGGQELPISRSAFNGSTTILDSGTTFTHLPMDLYKQFSNKFKQFMTKHGHKTAQAWEKLDTCFNITENDTKRVVIPTVSFTFKNNVKLNVDVSGILWPVNSSYMCLAFTAMSDPNLQYIIGNYQQKTTEVVYDVAGKRIGFIPKRCD